MINITIIVGTGFILSILLAALIANIYGSIHTKTLAKVEPSDESKTTAVSVVLPACNEERHIEAVLNRWSSITEPELQIIVVDDRSEDDTGNIIDQAEIRDSRIRKIHISELPQGWLGKVHALHQGTKQATGDWILFADADVHMKPATILKAITYAKQENLDFISVIPDVKSGGIFFDMTWNVINAFFNLGSKPWRIPDNTSNKIGASGAFMLVHREVFDRTPKFEWLRLEVADDFGLCLLIKSHQGRCALMNGQGEVELQWYESYRDMAVKMQKNIYAITGRFSIWRILLQSFAMTVFALFPILLLFTGNLEYIMYGIAMVGLLIFNVAYAAHHTGRARYPSLGAPLGFVLMAWMTLRAGILGWYIGGITWRGVLYPTEQLRAAQKVRI